MRSSRILPILFWGTGGAGLLLAVLALCSWAGYKSTEGVVTPEFQVTYSRGNGKKNHVNFPKESLPADARPGDHVLVMFDPHGKNDIVASFHAVWRIPVLAGLPGLSLIIIGWRLQVRRKLTPNPNPP